MRTLTRTLGAIIRNLVVFAVVLMAFGLCVSGGYADRVLDGIGLDEARAGGGTVAGVATDCDTDPRHGLTGEQLGNAATITAVGVDMDMPDRAMTVALATAMQESGLRNLDYGDRDSLGLFQQRPSQGWGSRSQVTDPEYASRAFYTALTRVGGWERMSITDAAQAVQVSAFPNAYQQHVDTAQRLAGELIPCAG